MKNVICLAATAALLVSVSTIAFAEDGGLGNGSTSNGGVSNGTPSGQGIGAGAATGGASGSEGATSGGR